MRSTAIRSAAVASAALCVTAIAGLGVADGHRFSAPAAVQIASGGPSGATGSVNTLRPRCRANRLVTLFKIEGPTRTKVGTDRTDAQGTWTVHANLTAGFYRAAVAPKNLPRTATTARKRKHRHHSQGAISQRARL